MPDRLRGMWGSVGLSVPTRNGLERLALGLRAHLETTWSFNTAHHSVEWGHGAASAGQCYVSSMAFSRAAEETWPSTKPVIHRGYLQKGNHTIIEDHGWVQMRCGYAEVVIDLTPDQAVPETPVIVASREDLSAAGYHYYSLDARPLIDVTNEDAWARYWILDAFLAPELSKSGLLGEF